jgi:nucleoside-diphosphate-sugar epimerase
MKILLTGANGFVGNKVRELLSKDHEVISLVRRPGLPEGEILLDLSDEAAVARAIEQKMIPDCGVVIHLASVTATPDSIHDLSILFRNATIAKSTALIARQINAAKLIHVSSMAVYPQTDGLFSEDARVDPSVNNDCIYGLSKFNAEVLLNFFLQRSNIQISHLRMAIVYGEGMPDSRIIPVMRKELEEAHTITVFGDGERLINQIEVNKAARVIRVFAEEDHPGTFNIGDECLSMEALAISINVGGKGRIVKKPEGKKTRFVLDLSKMRSRIGDVYRD